LIVASACAEKASGKKISGSVERQGSLPVNLGYEGGWLNILPFLHTETNETIFASAVIRPNSITVTPHYTCCYAIEIRFVGAYPFHALVGESTVTAYAERLVRGGELVVVEQ
jgi:hypothetical protein